MVVAGRRRWGVLGCKLVVWRGGGAREGGGRGGWLLVGRERMSAGGAREGVEKACWEVGIVVPVVELLRQKDS